MANRLNLPTGQSVDSIHTLQYIAKTTVLKCAAFNLPRGYFVEWL